MKKFRNILISLIVFLAIIIVFNLSQIKLVDAEDNNLSLENECKIFTSSIKLYGDNEHTIKDYENNYSYYIKQF